MAIVCYGTVYQRTINANNIYLLMVLSTEFWYYRQYTVLSIVLYINMHAGYYTSNYSVINSQALDMQTCLVSAACVVANKGPVVRSILVQNLTISS
jgi:hypothetical protein